MVQNHPDGAVGVPVMRESDKAMKSTFPRIDEWRLSQNARNLSPRTIEARIERLEDLAKYLGRDPSDAGTRELSEYMAMVSDRRNWRNEPLNASTMSTYHSHIAAWFDWLVQMEYRDDDPCSRLTPPRRRKATPRPVSDRELIAALAIPMHRRTRMMLYLAAFQGLRCHEIAKLRGEDVNLRDGLIRVKGKGNSDFTRELHEVVIKEAASYPTKGFWFPMRGDDTRPMGARSVSIIIGRLFDRAQIDGGAHRLRHWYATTLLHDGASTRLVQDLMRHASIQSTEIYTQVSPQDRAAAVARLKMPVLDDGGAISA